MAGILALMCELLQNINKNAWCGFDWELFLGIISNSMLDCKKMVECSVGM